MQGGRRGVGREQHTNTCTNTSTNTSTVTSITCINISSNTCTNMRTIPSITSCICSCTLSWQTSVQEESLCLDMIRQPSGRKLPLAGAAARVLLQVSTPPLQHAVTLCCMQFVVTICFQQIAVDLCCMRYAGTVCSMPSCIVQHAFVLRPCSLSLCHPSHNRPVWLCLTNAWTSTCNKSC